ncbi:MAG: hypothetical protein KC445_07845 [Anaerolineales bacterium]|nr:hypothetical protein [Anaerolineales bacterium]
MILTESLWSKIEDYLLQEKQRIFDEIVNYPPPIPACDVQFNFLLAERAAMMQDLQRLKGIAAGELATLRAFVQACKFFDDTLKASLLAGFEDVLDG